MKNIRRNLMILAVILLVIAAFIKTYDGRKIPIDQIYTIHYVGNGETLVTWYEQDDMNVAMIDREGKIKKSVQLPLEKDGLTYEIEAACAGEDDTVYLLLNSHESITGDTVAKDLYIYDFSKMFPTKTVISTDDLQTQPDEDPNTVEDIWDFRWMSISGSALSMIGVNDTSTKAVRKVFEFGTITNRSLNVKSERFYKIAEGEGVYQAIGNGTDIAYISYSGKLFHSTENSVTEVYPARELKELMYPLYLSYAETGFVYLQDGESGNILKLNLSDGSEETVMKGAATFSAAEVITPEDICMMSMTNVNNFSAVVKNSSGNGYHLLVLQDSVGYLIKGMLPKTSHLVVTFVKWFAIYFAIATAIILVLYGLFRSMIRGRTIMGRLMLAALPLMILAMSVFGIIAYNYYSNAISLSYQKQTEDEGNMMTALFGQESFDSLAYPYDYSSENYSYMQNQIAGRELYSRVIYFEDGELFTGVEKNTPCFYPIGIKVNSKLDAIYRKAALSGEPVTETIQDRAGKRVVSVTPMGGVSGRSVYLYETGVFTAALNKYQNSYIKSFVGVCVAFLIVVSVLLTAMFLQILQPLAEIKEGMEKFTGGNRDIRIEPETNDELAGICQAFNKMADDIDMQIMNLQNLSDTYYRFMPLGIIGILGEDNLGNLSLGSKIEGNYAVLSVQIQNLNENDSFHVREEKMNRFFHLINTQAVKQNVIPIVDSANLSGMLLICKEGVVSAVRTALAILANVDAYNAGIEETEQLDIMFLLHRSDIFVGICGDEERYIPVLITPELENMLRNNQILQKLGARLLVSGQAYSELGTGSGFESRYIGNLDIAEHKDGFYEFYDDRNAEEAHLLKLTESNFRKAMKLFEQGYLYEAKSLFAIVLQDNPGDLVARHYIFRCE